PEATDILFVPVMLLGAFVEKELGRRMHLWDGECHVHAVFLYTDTAATHIYTLSLHDALPISDGSGSHIPSSRGTNGTGTSGTSGDRKSTRLNSSHVENSYAVFCLKKKTNYVADSPGLSRQAAAAEEATIVFCGVHFMAETASI